MCKEAVNERYTACARKGHVCDSVDVCLKKNIHQILKEFLN